MDLQQPKNRVRLAIIQAAAAAVVVLVVVGLFSGGQLSGQIRIAPGQTKENEPTPSGVHLPNDRALSRAMTRARERLEAAEFQQALTFLQEILAREEDSFLDESPDATARLGLKAAARQMIGQLPPAGREAFELLYGAAARRDLNAAAASGDRAGVAQVVRQYFHTIAGYEAALVLAQMESDAGRHLAAGQLYKELLVSPRAVSQLDPQLSILAAVNLLAGGRAADSAETLKALIERSPNATIELSGRSVALPGSQGDLAAWLAECTGKPEASTTVELDWATSRGNSARNVQYPGGGPHLRTRWQARVVNDPTIEEYLNTRARQFAERGTVVLPAGRPLSVGDVVLMRTPSNIVAIDWQSGKRIWETREEEGFSNDELLPMLAGADNSQEPMAANMSNALELRLWDDALSMSLSSDGERAYVIRGANPTTQESELDFRLRVIGAVPGVVAASTNQLAAFELATEGKLAWELDGARGTGPLAGAFFLGAPLAVDNMLYVLAEIRFAIYLVAINPQNGQPQWRQQLLDLEQGISLDARRRMTGSSPSYSGGMLICPTAAGATIAVDVVRRELAWVYDYSRDAVSRSELQLMLQQQTRNQATRGAPQWLDSSVIVDEGRVFLTPPESQELHCVDLRTGEFAWKHRQGAALYVGCIDRGIILLVGDKSIEAIRTVDGAAAWQDRSIPLPEGTRPAGQGYLSEGHYYLPLSSGAVMAIDVAHGKQIGLTAGENGTRLGNLICARGSVISQSLLVVDKFEQMNVLQQRAEAALAQNGDDASALRELAELKRVAGNLTEAIGHLKRAQSLAPDDLLIREMLSEYLLAALADDYAAARGELPLLRRLITGRHHELQLLRIEAQGLEKLGQRLAAWDAYLRVADVEGGQWSDVEISTTHTVRSDRWLGGRLTALWAGATTDEQVTMNGRVGVAAAAMGTRPGIDAMQSFLVKFGGLPAAEVVRVQLATRLIAAQQLELAEIELLQLMNSQTPEVQVTAAALLAKAMIDGGRPEAASDYGALILRKWPSVFATDGLSGQQWVQRLAAETPAFGATLGRDWPRGRVTAQVEASQGPVIPQTPFGGPERQVAFRQLRIEQESSSGFHGEQWFLAIDGRTDSSHLMGRKADGRDFAGFSMDSTNRGGRRVDPPQAHGARLGSLLFVSVGGRITAIDTRQIEVSGQAMWEAQTLSVAPVNASTRRGARGGARAGVYDSRSVRKRDDSRQISNQLGPVTPRGVVYIDQDKLKCVDPLSGDMLWTRSDVPRASELFGDGEWLFAVNPNVTIPTDANALVINMTDGEIVKRRPAPKFSWLITAGRNVAGAGARSTGAVPIPFTIVDMLSGDAMFESKFQAESHFAVVEPNLVAVYEPTGKFQLVDVSAGKLLINEQLAAFPRAQNIQVDLSGNEVILVISSAVQAGRHQSIAAPGAIADYPLVNGLVYAFDRHSGRPLWPAPASVDERGLVLAAPQDSPFIVFTDRETRRDTTGEGAMKLRLLCLDKRTGESVYRNDGLLDVSDGKFRVQHETVAAAPGGNRIVTIETTSQKVQLTLTSDPRPPEPPARDELTANREIGELGIRGALLRATESLQQSQRQNQPDANRRGRGRRGGE